MSRSPAIYASQTSNGCVNVALIIVTPKGIAAPIVRSVQAIPNASEMIGYQFTQEASDRDSSNLGIVQKVIEPGLWQKKRYLHDPGG